MHAASKSPVSLVTSRPRTPTQLTTHYDHKYETVWCYMHATPRACFSPELLADLINWCDELAHGYACPQTQSLQYHVLASSTPGVYNLGGDLELFGKLVKARNRQALQQYATDCIDALYSNIVHFNRELTTISLVQGDALGGGFETALSSDVLIAERGSKLGFPEVLFNLFPGMGAYSLLSRKLDSARAEQMILSGKIYTAEELHEIGVVDILAEELQGEMAVYDYIRKENRSANGFRALRAAKRSVNAIPYEELNNIAQIWVDAALRLSERDLRMMERLVTRQSGKARGCAA